MGCAFTSAIHTRLCIICLFCNTLAVVVHVPDVVVVQLPVEQAIIPCNFTRRNPDAYYRIVWESRRQNVIRTDSSGRVYKGRRYPDANLPWSNCTLTLSHPGPQHSGDYWVTVMVSKEEIVHHKTRLMIKNEDKALPLPPHEGLLEPKPAIQTPTVTGMWRNNGTTESLDKESAVDVLEANVTVKARLEPSNESVSNFPFVFSNTGTDERPGWILTVLVTAAAVVVILLLFIIVWKVNYRKRSRSECCENQPPNGSVKGCPIETQPMAMTYTEVLERNTDDRKNDYDASSPNLDYTGSSQPLMETSDTNAKDHVRNQPVISVTCNRKNGSRRCNAEEQKCINSISHPDHGSAAGVA